MLDGQSVNMLLWYTCIHMWDGTRNRNEVFSDTLNIITVQTMMKRKNI